MRGRLGMYISSDLIKQRRGALHGCAGLEKGVGWDPGCTRELEKDAVGGFFALGLWKRAGRPSDVGCLCGCGPWGGPVDGGGHVGGGGGVEGGE